MTGYCAKLLPLSPQLSPLSYHGCCYMCFHPARWGSPTHFLSTDTKLLLHKPKPPEETTLGKQATIHQVTTMLATSKNVLFPVHNHLLTTGADDLTLLIIAQASVRMTIKVKGQQHWWLADGYDLEIGHF